MQLVHGIDHLTWTRALIVGVFIGAGVQLMLSPRRLLSFSTILSCFLTAALAVYLWSISAPEYGLLKTPLLYLILFSGGVAAITALILTALRMRAKRL